MSKIALSSNEFERTDVFDAVIREVELRDGDYGQQVVIGVEPTSFEYQPSDPSKGAYMPLYFKYSTSDKSNWFKFVRAIEDLGVKLNELEDLVNKHFRWRRHEDTYVIEGEEKTSRYSLPFKKLKPVQEQTQLTEDEADETEPETQPEEKPKVKPKEKGDDLEGAIMEFIDDGEPHQVKELYDELGKKGHSKGKVLKAVKSLEGNGKLVLADNNVVKE